MSPSLTIPHVALRVADLTRSVEFYTQQLGFVLSRHEGTSADLATAANAPALLSLEEDRHAPPASPAQAGLFHAALLFPSRAALGGWLRFAANRGVEFDGASDHVVSDAIYFSDPDGNGLEFYADRPRADWPYRNGEVAMSTRPCDLAALLQEGRLAVPPLAGARWGHLHFRVTDLHAAETFYTGRLGLAVTQRTYPGARFLAADGYHHHLGLNTWGQPHAAQPAGRLGLKRATFALRGAPAVTELHDPDGIAIRIEAT
jgi:catechol 2,3-dioxygenase